MSAKIVCSLYAAAIPMLPCTGRFPLSFRLPFFSRHRSGFHCTFRAPDQHEDLVRLPDELSVLSVNGGVWESGGRHL